MTAPRGIARLNRCAALLALPLLLSACGETATQPRAFAPCLAAIAMPDPADPSAGMIWIPGGETTMGARPLHAQEGPPRRVHVDGFFIDATDVTNAQFAAFVAATGYVTVAERGPAPASPVFVGASGTVDLADPSQWWRLVPHASWRAPFGPGSTIEGRDTEPVVHAAYEDALAYARWLGRDLPTEAEWEYAARGGLEGAAFVWGDEAGGARRANTWQGIFPFEDSGADGYRASVSPVGCFPANGFGLYDMAGNVWQWTKDVYETGGGETPGAGAHVIKGGSFLCSDTFCYRFRPAARTGAATDSGASHIGFRTVYRPSAADASRVENPS